MSLFAIHKRVASDSPTAGLLEVQLANLTIIGSRASCARACEGGALEIRSAAQVQISNALIMDTRVASSGALPALDPQTTELCHALLPRPVLLIQRHAHRDLPEQLGTRLAEGFNFTDGSKTTP